MWDPEKDVLIKLFEMNGENNKSLLMSLMKYDEGEIKLQITRSYVKKDETIGYGKMGRLSKKELIFLKNNIDEMLNIMESNQ